MHKILHILGTAIHILSGMSTMLIMHTFHASLCIEKKKGSNDTAKRLENN